MEQLQSINDKPIPKKKVIKPKDNEEVKSTAQSVTLSN